MGPGVDNLLLNLKLQLLALPSLAWWGLLTFAGILVLREAIVIGWNHYHLKSGRPGMHPPTQQTPHPDSVEPGSVSQAAAAALPAPDPLAQPFVGAPEAMKSPQSRHQR